MSYTINRFNGAQVAVVADGTIDSTLDLKLIGKNYAGYGAVQNENFVYLLENFANSTQPPRPVSGQLWFDSGSNKLKFYDTNGKFRIAGGAEISATQPTGLTTGDFWWDTTNQQLWSYNGSGFTLVGPQGVAGSATTQMRSVSVLDDHGGSHAIIQAIDNGTVIFTISSDNDFVLNTSANAITGFTTIRQGVTLIYSNNDSLPGQTTSSHRFWGTSTNSDRLGGLSASNFIQTGNAVFSSLVQFGDAGFTVGATPAKLKIYNSAATTPTFINQVGDTLAFQTTVNSVTKNPLNLVGTAMLPGSTLTNNIGSSSLQWNNIYANYVYGTAQQADSLSVSGTYRSASTSSTVNTIAVRDSNGNLNANLFQGTATSANYADLAEKYLTDVELTPGTVVAVGGSAEVRASVWGERAIGVVSTNPAYMMNSELEGGQYIALKGRVPCRVVGPVNKGDQLLAANNGYAVSMANIDDTGVTALYPFGIALESFDGSSETGTIEVIVL
jgi:hypothetical protein